MVHARTLWTCLLIGIVLIGGVSETAAQPSAGCASHIETAETQYRNGAFEAAISTASECLNQPSVAPEQAVQAYRTLALAHIKLDELGAARTAIVNLLGTNPNYMPDRVNDPPVFVSMVSLVKQNLQLDLAVVTPQQTQSPPTPSIASKVPPSAVGWIPEEEAPPAPFFERTSTWLTIGGILIGGGAKSGNHATGLGIGVLGVGAGGTFSGIGVGGIGVGSGDALTGIMIGGLGVGSGKRLDGIAVGGVGVGTGGTLRGLAIGGVGVGSGQALRGIAIGGLAVGTGGDFTGGALSLIGVGARGDITGFTATGIGLGAGKQLRGFHVAGIGLAAPRITGVAVGGIASSEEVVGGIVAPLYVRITDTGRITGASISLFNHIKGEQRGLTIGVLNVADTLQGVQLGVLNYAGNNPPLLRILPVLNLHL